MVKQWTTTFDRNNIPIVWLESLCYWEVLRLVISDTISSFFIWSCFCIPRSFRQYIIMQRDLHKYKYYENLNAGTMTYIAVLVCLSLVMFCWAGLELIEGDHFINYFWYISFHKSWFYTYFYCWQSVNRYTGM